MTPEHWQKKRREKKLRRAPVEEMVDRYGHWYREFYSRLEVWPVAEPWVLDHNFHMIAAKGKRRLYIQENGPFYRTYVDIKQYETTVTVSAWIEVTFLTRFLSLFLIPSEMFPDPSGFLGVRQRRLTARLLNDLLQRFNQAPILGSDSFHFLDLDSTTLLLLLAMILPFIGFGLGSLPKFELAPGLSNSLLMAIGKHWSTLAGTGLGLVLAHHFISAKRFEPILFRGISAGLAFLIYFIVGVVSLTRTASEMAETKFYYHCLTHYKEAKCQPILENLPQRGRDAMASRLQTLQKQLSTKR